jgi:hypothetical protein
VQIFGKGLGHLDRETVQIETIPVTGLGEPFASGLGGAAAHRQELKQRIDLGL